MFKLEVTLTSCVILKLIPTLNMDSKYIGSDRCKIKLAEDIEDLGRFIKLIDKLNKTIDVLDLECQAEIFRNLTSYVLSVKRLETIQAEGFHVPTCIPIRDILIDPIYTGIKKSIFKTETKGYFIGISVKILQFEILFYMLVRNTIKNRMLTSHEGIVFDACTFIEEKFWKRIIRENADIRCHTDNIEKIIDIMLDIACEFDIDNYTEKQDTLYPNIIRFIGGYMRQMRDDIQTILKKPKTEILFNNMTLNKNTIPLMHTAGFHLTKIDGLTSSDLDKVREYLIRKHNMGKYAVNSSIGYLRLVNALFDPKGDNVNNMDNAIHNCLYCGIELDPGHRNTIQNVLWTIESKECLVIRERFGIGVREPKTLDAVGTLLHVTAVRARQIEQKALRKLRHPTRLKFLKVMYQEFSSAQRIEGNYESNKR